MLVEETDGAVDVALVGIENDDSETLSSSIGLGLLVGELVHAVGQEGVSARRRGGRGLDQLVVGRTAEEMALVLDEEEFAETVAEGAEVLNEHAIFLGELVILDILLVCESEGEKASDAVLVAVDGGRGGRSSALDTGKREVSYEG